MSDKLKKIIYHSRWALPLASIIFNSFFDVMLCDDGGESIKKVKKVIDTNTVYSKNLNDVLGNGGLDVKTDVNSKILETRWFNLNVELLNKYRYYFVIARLCLLSCITFIPESYYVSWMLILSYYWDHGKMLPKTYEVEYGDYWKKYYDNYWEVVVPYKVQYLFFFFRVLVFIFLLI